MGSDALYTSCSSCGKTMLKSLSQCPKCGGRKKFEFSVWQLAGAGVIVLFLIGVLSDRDNKAKESHQGQGSSVKLAGLSKDSEDEKALQKVSLSYNWRKTGFDSVMEADLIVTNNNGFEVKDVVIECRHFGKSGTKIDSNEKTIFDVVGANSTKVFSKFNMGFIHSQADSSDCSVKRVSARSSLFSN